MPRKGIFWRLIYSAHALYMNVTSFQQSSLLNFLIDFNTEKRQKAANDFGKDFFKLMDKTIFGKTMENLRKRVNL